MMLMFATLAMHCSGLAVVMVKKGGRKGTTTGGEEKIGR